MPELMDVKESKPFAERKFTSGQTGSGKNPSLDKDWRDHLKESRCATLEAIGDYQSAETRTDAIDALFHLYFKIECPWLHFDWRDHCAIDSLDIPAFFAELQTMGFSNDENIDYALARARIGHVESMQNYTTKTEARAAAKRWVKRRSLSLPFGVPIIFSPGRPL